MPERDQAVRVMNDMEAECQIFSLTSKSSMREIMNRVLVVDDEPSICRALAMGLALKDFEVDVAGDGNSAILLGNRNNYDILVADLCLPDMDGLEVIRELKRINPEIISIVITGNSNMASSIEAIHLGVSDYLEKPLSTASVLDSITRGLEKQAEKRKTMRKQLGRDLKMYKEESDGKKALESSVGNNGNDQLTETVHMLAHQSNNNLASITGSAELAMFKLDDADTVRKLINRIIKASEKLNYINREFMKLGQPAEGKIENLNLRSLLKDCIDQFEDLLFLKGIWVETDFESFEISAQGNRFKFEQIFNNLILNAIDSMSGRWKRLITITATVDTKGSSTSIHIEDTGCGISEEMLDMIFKPYFTKKEHGNGLGLYITKKLAEEMSCNIYVGSRVEKGTKFTVQIPVPN